MARHKEDSMDEEQWQLDQSLPYKSDELEQRRRTEYPAEVVRTSSREELMECIKRGQRPTWVPNSAFQALRDEEEALVAQRRMKSEKEGRSTQGAEHERQAAPSTTSVEHLNSESKPGPPSAPFDRPRSALHKGNFSEVESDSSSDFWSIPAYQPGIAISTSGVSASSSNWYPASPRPTSLDAMPNARALSQLSTTITQRRRAPSLGSSLSSSFVMRAPTSPLVYSTSNRDQSSSSDAEQETPRRDNTRRRTMPPSSFHTFSMTPIDATPPNFSRPFALALRREASLPTQAHNPRHSLNSFTYHPRTNSQTAFGRSRGPSMTSESGSRRRKSMVGSFEESILRGRMSTPPSKPLDFVAQIGVMGKGDCPSSLKCPAHVSVPFPAVFYSYPASAGAESFSDHAPSPYVGTVNLSGSLKPVVLAAKKGKTDTATVQRSTHSQPAADEDGTSMDASKLHVGGAYRVPQQGQLQIMIKNPNKTAVKLFLIPYDLSGMEAGTKTFVRQRSFSTGPIIDSMQGDTSMKAAMADPLQDKHILRYLVHLRFCCPAKNRFYLYDNVRVVFANRVPDGKEKLRNELQLPEPKFSTWKPSQPERSAKPPKSAPTTPTVNALDLDSPQFFGDMEGFLEAQSPASPTPLSSHRSRPSAPAAPAFDLRRVSSRAKAAARSLSSQDNDKQRTPFEFPDINDSQTLRAAKKAERPLSPVTGFGTTTPLRSSPVPWRSPPSGAGSNRSFSPIPMEARDSLLSRQLKELSGRFSPADATTELEPTMRETRGGP
ncbi:hypothetical protein PMZ80_003265 [Knufia obscura]|uniref:Atos-like conserved domain-containing protein n=2 Tax=Knufia TaxID=430999 RepID=A0AAN8EGP2_9EURO|nr:hypothetical protein PMZ80_003265 [Knufia obscura]KAK5950382.1 hypothetical protein OHC33_008601 [Knufia fluminis]